MTNRERNPFAKGQLRSEATNWFLTMRDRDAEQHRAEFEKWLARGAMHRAAYNSIAHTYLIGDVNWDGLPPPQPVRGTVIRTRFALAGLLMLLACLVWRVVVPSDLASERQREQPAAVIARAPAQFVTRLGEVRRIKLADGSHIILDTDTLVSVDYRKDERDLRLEHGRARFEVAHEGRPFVVEAGDSEVIARGTVFDVSVLEPDEVRVHLLRGKVEVRSRRQGPRRDMIHLAVLQPGQEMLLDDDTAPTRPSKPRTEPVSDWPSGSIDFAHSTLGEVIATANRYSVTKIRLATPEMERLPASGVFRVNDPDRLAKLLSQLFKLEITRAPGEIILSKPGK